MMSPMEGPGWGALAMGFLPGALLLTVLATLVAVIAPRWVSRLGAIIGEEPFRTLGTGFVTQPTPIGAAILLTATLIGIFVAPLTLIAAVVLRFLGYIVGGLPAGRLGDGADRGAGAGHLPRVRAGGGGAGKPDRLGAVPGLALRDGAVAGRGGRDDDRLDTAANGAAILSGGAALPVCPRVNKRGKLLILAEMALAVHRSSINLKTATDHMTAAAAPRAD